MTIYYHSTRVSQPPCAYFTSIDASHSRELASNFATFTDYENKPESLAAQAIPAKPMGEGLVYGPSHTSYTSPPVYTHTDTPTLTHNEAASTFSKQLPFMVRWFEKQPEASKRYISRMVDRSLWQHPKKRAWDDLPAEEKKRRTLDFAFRSESVAWTLNLTPKQEERLKLSKTPAKLLADAINRACKRELGHSVPLSLALEVTSKGRLHAHGIATLAKGEGKGFRNALKSAGGKVTGSQTGRQTDIRKLWDAEGWAAYMDKAFELTAVALHTDKIVYQCNVTRAGAREEYEASRLRQQARQSVNIDLSI